MESLIQKNTVCTKVGSGTATGASVLGVQEITMPARRATKKMAGVFIIDMGFKGLPKVLGYRINK
jgi:hypothetical protein